MVTPLFSSSFLFLRHGRTALNAEDSIQGARDVPLDPIGANQAHAAAEVLAGREVAAIWSSPLSRARRTAEIVGARFGLPVRTVPELAERNWGTWEGRPRHGLDREATPPEGEGPAAFAARTDAGLARVTPPFPVLIVAHSGTFRIVAAMLLPRATIRRVGNGEVVLWRRTASGWQPESLTGGLPLSCD